MARKGSLFVLTQTGYCESFLNPSQQHLAQRVCNALQILTDSEGVCNDRHAKAPTKWTNHKSTRYQTGIGFGWMFVQSVMIREHFSMLPDSPLVDGSEGVPSISDISEMTIPGLYCSEFRAFMRFPSVPWFAMVCPGFMCLIICLTL